MSAALHSHAEVIAFRDAAVKARRVTEVRATIEATGVDAVCTAGNVAAIHFATRRGLIVVRCPLKSFIAQARAPRDHNGRPFELPVEPRVIVEADAAAVPVTKGGPREEPAPYTPRRDLTPEALARLRRAFAEARHPVRVARELGVSPNTVYRRFRQFAKEAASPRAPIAKPNGKLL